MATEIASLGLAIDSSSARTATEDLRKFANESARAEGAQRDLANATEAGMAIVRRGWRDNSDFNKAVLERTRREREAAAAIRERANADTSATSATQQATAALQQTNRTVDHLGVRTESSARSYGAMVAAIMRGDFQQANASLATLASRMAVIPALTTPAGAAVAGLTVVVGALGAAMTVAALEADKFNRLLEATGQRSGLTVGSMSNLRNEIGSITNDYKDAAVAVQELVKWGRVGGTELDTMARAAAIWGRNTGQAASEVLRELMALSDGGTDALLKLNDSYGFLTPAVYRQIEAIREQRGDMAAMRETMLLVDSVTIDLMETTDESTGNIASYWNRATEAAKGYFRQIMDWGRTDNEYLLEKQAKRVADAERALAEAREYAAKLGTPEGGAVPARIADLEREQAALAEIQAQVELEQTRAENEAAQRRANQASMEAEARIRQNDERINEEKRFGREVARVRQDFLKMVQAEDFAGLDELGVTANFDLDAGWTFSGGAYDRRIEALEKQRDSRVKLTDAEKEAARVSREQQATFDRLSRQAAAYASELEETAESGDKLSKVERFIKVTRDQMAAGTVSLTAAQREELKVRLDQLEVDERRRRETVANNEAMAREVELRARLDERMQTAAAAAEREVAAIGMTRREREMSAELDKIANDALRERLRLTKAWGEEATETNQRYMEQMALIDQHERQRIDLARRSAKARLEAESDWRSGVRTAVLNVRDETMNYAKMSEAVVTDSYGAMTNAIMTFSRTGKFEIKDMTISILDSMMQMAAQITASQILRAVLGAFMPMPTGATGTTAVGYQSYGAARGAAFQGGNVLAFARGGVVNRPTYFPMAGGRTGLMGEAGGEGEAVMPLGRDSSGRLGVRVVSGAGGGGGTIVNAVTNVNISSDGSVTSTATATTGDEQREGRALGALLTERVKAIIVEQTRPGGLLWSMQNGR